jgi:hypothetical protein
MSDPSDDLSGQLQQIQKRVDDLARQNEQILREVAIAIRTMMKLVLQQSSKRTERH